MENIEIIKLPIERWEEYKNLRLEALRAEPTVFSASFEEKEKIPDLEWQKDLGGIIYFAQVNEKLVGMAGEYRETGKKSSHIAVIFGIYLNKDFRGKGIGRKLLQTLLNELENQEDIVKLNLDVNTTQTSAVELYKSLGFEIVGELKKEYLVDGKFYDVYEMEKYLK